LPRPISRGPTQGRTRPKFVLPFYFFLGELASTKENGPWFFPRSCSGCWPLPLPNGQNGKRGDRTNLTQGCPGSFFRFCPARGRPQGTGGPRGPPQKGPCFPSFPPPWGGPRLGPRSLGLPSHSNPCGGPQGPWAGIGPLSCPTAPSECSHKGPGNRKSVTGNGRGKTGGGGERAQGKRREKPGRFPVNRGGLSLARKGPLWNGGGLFTGKNRDVSRLSFFLSGKYFWKAWAQSFGGFSGPGPKMEAN